MLDSVADYLILFALFPQMCRLIRHPPSLAMRIVQQLLFVFLCSSLLSSGNSFAAPQHGADGAPGARWQPGGNGGNGTDITAIRSTIGAPFSWIAQGFNGGRGGRGGEGFIWNAKPEDSTAGMTGGNGGRGGHTSAIWTPMVTIGPDGPIYQRSVYVEARAGNGGAGGAGGNGFQGGRIGNPGIGGDGGSAHAMAYGGFEVTARAVGGMGGSTSGLGGQAGHGGHASSSVVLVNPRHHSTDLPATIWMATVGGRGGDGLDRSRGGNGGTSLHGGQYNNYRVQGNDNALPWVNLDIVGRGGDGGNSVGARGGAGGHSIVELNTMLGARRFESYAYVLSPASASFNLFGGRGGNSLAHALASGHGGEGGSVNLRRGFESTHPYGQELNISARGGRGGDALGSFGGYGGRGGAVSLDLILSGGNININLRGGDGGHSQSENGGSGRTVSLSELSYVGESDLSRYNITIQGGDGGNLLGSNTQFQGTSRRAGYGGSAIMTSSGNLPYLFGRQNDVRAIGGWAGRGIGTAGEERAGDAIVEIRETIRSAGTLNVIADGGRSYERTNGNARAIVDLRAATAIPGVSGVVGAITGSATARPHQYVGGPTPVPQAAFGGNAWAESYVSRTNAFGFISAIANAEGGFGTTQSGSGRALATAINNTDVIDFHNSPRNREAFASATALSRADGSASSSNNAISKAKAESKVFGEAYATSRTQGQYNYSLANAEFRAPTGTVTATAEGETSQWVHRSTVTSSATSHTSLYATPRMGAWASTAFRHPEMVYSEQPDPNAVRSASSHLLINPGQTAIDQFTSSSTLIDQAFDFGTKSSQVGNVLMIGNTSASNYTLNFVNGDFQVKNQFDVTLHLFPSIQDTDELSLAFFNPYSSRDGFESLAVKFDYQGVNILDVNFTDLATAQNFFTDNIISLDNLVLTDGLERQFKLEFDMRFANTYDGFGFDFLVGNRNQMASLSAFSAVPEPTAIPALIGFAAAILLRRRRR